MRLTVLISVAAFATACNAAIANWANCKVGGESCNAGFTCCVGKNDLSSGKTTCRQGDCASATVSSAAKVVANWATCQAGDKCNSGYTCCLTPGSTKYTCRLAGYCAASSGSGVTSGVSSSNFYSGFSGKVPATTGLGDASTTTLPGGFSGLNKGIGSWFRSVGDSTNGNSWCGYPYKDYTRGFAPDIGVITEKTYAVYGHPQWETYGKRYCGLEAVVYNPNNGRALTLYITDGFDTKWVRTPGSIDIHKQVWDYLFGRESWNKNDVIKGVEWKLTGKRSAKYSFKGAGDR